MDMMNRSKAKNKYALDEIVKRLIPADGIAVKCPECHVEWNRLTPSGVCVNCEDQCATRS